MFCLYLDVPLLHLVVDMPLRNYALMQCEIWQWNIGLDLMLAVRRENSDVKWEQTLETKTQP